MRVLIRAFSLYDANDWFGGSAKGGEGGGGTLSEGGRCMMKFLMENVEERERKTIFRSKLNGIETEIAMLREKIR